MINELIEQAEAEYGEELARVLPELEQKIHTLRRTAVEKYPDIPRGPDGLDSGTISIEDARLLYVLVRTLKPKVIFEIGTWIGTSAMVMAEAMQANNNGGKIYTCDANRYYALDESYSDTITTINAYSDKALQEVPVDSIIDFVFADGELTFSTIRALKPRLAKDAVIATHDFTLPAEKGVLNLVRMQLMSFCKYSYVLPKENGYSKYNSGAMGILGKHTSGKKRYVIKPLFLTVYLLIKIIFVKLITKTGSIS